MTTTTDIEKTFWVNVVSNARVASELGLRMSVWLKSGEHLIGIPTVEGNVEAMPYDETVTIEHTPFIAREVDIFAMASP
jgi:hypothetical protein